MAEIKKLSENTEYYSVSVGTKKLYFNPDDIDKERKFYSDLDDKAIRHKLEIDPWMDLMNEFVKQMHSTPIIVGEFIEKMKDKFNLEFKNQ